MRFRDLLMVLNKDFMRPEIVSISTGRVVYRVTAFVCLD